MKLKQFVVAGVVSFSFASIAVAQRSQQEGAQLPQGDQTTRQEQGMTQERSQAGEQQGQVGSTVEAMRGAANEPMGGQDPQTIREVQEKLNERGYNAGPVDGVYGPKTRAAIEDFQKYQGIDATGQLSEDTLAGLGIESEAAAGAARGEGVERDGARTGAVLESDQEDSQRPGAGEGTGEATGAESGAISEREEVQRPGAAETTGEGTESGAAQQRGEAQTMQQPSLPRGQSQQ